VGHKKVMNKRIYIAVRIANQWRYIETKTLWQAYFIIDNELQNLDFRLTTDKDSGAYG
jgi:hypothetical protein